MPRVIGGTSCGHRTSPDLSKTERGQDHATHILRRPGLRGRGDNPALRDAKTAEAYLDHGSGLDTPSAGRTHLRLVRRLLTTPRLHTVNERSSGELALRLRKPGSK